MKKYKFRLESVLRIRRLQEDQAKNLLLEANAELARSVEVVRVRVERYVSITAAPGLLSPDDFAKSRFLWDQAARAVQQAEELREVAAAVVSLRRDEYLEASKAVQVLERLDARRRDEYQIELARDEAAEVDDIVVGRYGRHSMGVAS